MISFNVPPFYGTELEYVKQAVDNRKICGDGPFTKHCHEILENSFNAQKFYLLQAVLLLWKWLRFYVIFSLATK